jgi:hypothetical protein
LENQYRRLSDIEIQEVYERLELDTEEKRQKVLSNLYFSQKNNNNPIRIKGDSVTAPYDSN